VKRFTILLATVLLLTTIACKKEKRDCFDAQLYEQFKDGACPQDVDCTGKGVLGCDGKIYNNECNANKEGIRVKGVITSI